MDGPPPLTDLYGFPIDLTPHQLADLQRARHLYARQEQEWAKYAEKRQLPVLDIKKKGLCRGGVPPKLRSWVWPEVSGAKKLRVENPPNYYSNLVKAATLSRYASQVELVRRVTGLGYGARRVITHPVAKTTASTCTNLPLSGTADAHEGDAAASRGEWLREHPRSSSPYVSCAKNALLCGSAIPGAPVLYPRCPLDQHAVPTVSRAVCVRALQDLPRTFPGHAYINSADGQGAMRRILTSYSVHNPHVGYCQVGRHNPARGLVPLRGA